MVLCFARCCCCGCITVPGCTSAGNATLAAVCVCMQDIPAGAVLVRVPLRLAITDVMEEEEQQRVVGQVGSHRAGLYQCTGTKPHCLCSCIPAGQAHCASSFAQAIRTVAKIAAVLIVVELHVCRSLQVVLLHSSSGACQQSSYCRKLCVRFSGMQVRAMTVVCAYCCCRRHRRHCCCCHH